MRLEVVLGLLGLVGTVSGVVGGFLMQWYQSRREAPKLDAEARKLNAEAEKTAADSWHELYNEVCKRLEALEKKCTGLRALIDDVESLKQENDRLRNKVNMIIHWYMRLYHQALDAGLQPEYVPPEPEEIEARNGEL